MAITLTTHYGFDKPALGDANWGTPRNTNMDDLDAELYKPRIGQAALTWGATTTVDLSLARFFTGTNTQISTIAFSNVPSTFPNGAAVPVVRVVLLITNGGAFAITWPASVAWVGGAGPALRASGVDILELITRDGGTTWYASKMASNSLIYQNQGLSTTSTSEVSLAAFTVPAGMLATDGQCLRFTLCGTVVTQAATNLRVKFGATSVLSFTPAAGKEFFLTGLITRTGAATQRAHGFYVDNSSPSAAIAGRTLPAETLSGAVVLDFRGSVTAGGTLHFDSVEVEFLGG